MSWRSIAIICSGLSEAPNFLGLNEAKGRRLAQRLQRLQDSSAEGRRGSIDVTIDCVGRILVEVGLGRMGSRCPSWPRRLSYF